jgi:hypothetical protein
MESVKQVLSGIAQNKPLAEVFQGVQQARLISEVGARRVNPIFEDLRGDSELHPQWRFCVTLGRATPPALDMYRVMRELQAGHGVPQEAREPLDELSQQMSAVRALIGQETATERDFCLYLHFLNQVAPHLVNSPVTYRIELPADDDGVNGQLLAANVLQYDSWQIERLVTVLRLLQLHVNPREQLAPKQRLEQHQRCVDCLRELLRLCTQVMAGGPTDARVYRRPLTSMSSGGGSGGGGGDGTVEPVVQRDARAFVETCLGGLVGVEARMHLCEAQRREEVYRDLVERKLDGDQEGTLVMGAIIEAYEQARCAGENHNSENKLSHHTRFMRDLWFCRANLAIAQRLVGGGGQEALAEAVQRVECIARLHKARSFDKRSFTLDAALLQQYNAVIRHSDQAFRDWDHELYTKYRARPLACEFVIEKHQFTEKASSFALAMQKCTGGPLERQLQLLGAIQRAEVLPLEHGGGGGIDLTQAMEELLGRAKHGDSARLGALAMQDAWIQWVLALVEQNEFIMDTQYVQLLQSGQRKTRDALARHTAG